VACKVEHDLPVGQWGIHLLDDGPWECIDGRFNWNKIPTPTRLCDLCEERTAAGRQPSCVHHCLAGVMQYGPVEELARELESKPNQVLFVPKPYSYR
jgi:anaerobic dimethyl sulfoxide reductase subunit B (iron-sulfur subunit)